VQKPVYAAFLEAGVDLDNLEGTRPVIQIIQDCELAPDKNSTTSTYQNKTHKPRISPQSAMSSQKTSKSELETNAELESTTTPKDANQERFLARLKERLHRAIEESLQYPSFDLTKLFYALTGFALGAVTFTSPALGGDGCFDCLEFEMIEKVKVVVMGMLLSFILTDFQSRVLGREMYKMACLLLLSCGLALELNGMWILVGLFVTGQGAAGLLAVLDPQNSEHHGPQNSEHLGAQTS